MNDMTVAERIHRLMEVIKASRVSEDNGRIGRQSMTWDNNWNKFDQFQNQKPPAWTKWDQFRNGTKDK